MEFIKPKEKQTGKQKHTISYISGWNAAEGMAYPLELQVTNAQGRGNFNLWHVLFSPSRE